MRTIRRKEFAEDNPERIHEILDAVRHGHLALLDPRGEPTVRPMNFVRLGDRVYFHGARAGEKVAALASPVALVADEPLASIPSTWRHAQLACPATTYYRSVMVHGRARIVDDPAEKAAALEAFMRRYQPEGGYRPIDAGDPIYRGPLAGVLVFALDLAGATCKVKVGQHLDAAARRRVFEGLMARQRSGDLETAVHMARHDPALDAQGRLYPRQDGTLTWTDRKGDVPVDQLHALLAGTYWAHLREHSVIDRSLAGSTLVLAALDAGRMVAFARVLTDAAIAAWIYDVVVAPDRRGQGLGGRLMRRLLAHPVLDHVATIMLTTRDAQSFYGPLGFVAVSAFTGRAGPTTMMVLRRDTGRVPSGRASATAELSGELHQRRIHWADKQRTYSNRCPAVG